MERLTVKDKNGYWRIRDFTEILPAYWQACNHLAAYEDTGLTPEKIRAQASLFGDIIAALMDHDEIDPYDHIRELLQAEEDRLVVVLPCRRGDKVWRICGPKGRKFVAERTVLSVTLYGPGKFEVFTTTSDWLGKTVFLTREEAEAALSEKRGNHETNL